MNMQFAQQTVIVTGAAHGIGRAIAAAFAERGACVWMCDMDAPALNDTLAICRGLQPDCDARLVDVGQPAQVQTFVREVVAARRGVHVLVNVAGGVLGQVGRPLEQVTPREWQAIYDVNASGTFYFAQAVSPHMKRSAYGRIINISSGAGLGISLTGIQAYASAKAAQIGLTRQLAHELGPFNITVNSIAPGFVRSNANTEKQWQSYGDEGQRKLVDGIALRRLGRPEDIANGVLFFASELASWVTGQVLSVDGGR